jgi:hypothetical protein
MKPKQDAKIIFSPQLANFLLSRGHTIIKLKPKRGAENESVFVFQMDEDLLLSIEDWTNLAPESYGEDY